MKRKKEWAQHSQCNKDVQNLEDKPWKNEELRSAEEALPRVKESHLEEVSRFYKAKTGVVCDCFHPEVSVDLTKETTGEIVEFLEKVEQSGKWQQQACTTMFFLIPKNVTTERLIALMPTLIRWWGALRALEVAKQQKYRVGWDATDGRNGGPSKRCGKFWWRWKDSMTKQKKKIKGASALVVDLAKAFERVSLPVIFAWATHFGFSRKILRMLCGYFEHQRRVQFEGCAADRSQPSRLSCQG